jgi:peptidoglycan/LPS O-acetylase OafA/YrhL
MRRLIAVFGMLVFIIAPILAQELPPTPETPWEAIGQFSYLIGSYAGAVTLMFFFVPFVLGGLNITGKFLKYLFTILCVTVIVLAAYFLSFGYLYGAYWWTIPVNIGFLMLVQIGIFSWDVTKDIQDKIYEKFNPWKPSDGG